MVSESQLSDAFSESDDLKERGRQFIIDSGSVEDFWLCVEHARKLTKPEDLEFWLVEIVTSGADPEVLGNGLLTLAKEVLVPQGRVYEAVFFLRYIAPALFGDQHREATSLMAQCEVSLAENRVVESNEGWRDYDLTGKIEAGKSQQHYYDRFLAYFHATNDGERAELMAKFQVNFLPMIYGFFLGMFSSIVKYGVQTDTVIKAFDDFWKSAYPNVKPGIPRGRSKAEYQSNSGLETIESKREQKPPKLGYGTSKS